MQGRKKEFTSGRNKGRKDDRVWIPSDQAPATSCGIDLKTRSTDDLGLVSLGRIFISFLFFFYDSKKLPLQQHNSTAQHVEKVFQMSVKTTHSLTESRN